jgi:hypothetical protein
MAATPLEAQRALLRMAEVTRMISLMTRERGSMAQIGWLRRGSCVVAVIAEDNVENCLSILLGEG